MKNGHKVFLLISLGCIELLFLSNDSLRRLSISKGSEIQKKSSRDTLPSTFGFGRPATPAEIAKLDIDIRPDGQGLPPGTGTAAEGKAIFDLKCAACHGVGGIGGPNGSLAINPDPQAARREKVIGNYWPYATTIFDYIRWAMF